MAFYEQAGPDVFRSTEHTVGPWAPTDQHAGPPSALLARALEAELGEGGWLARIAVDLLGAVPVVDVTVRARTLRPGRAIRLGEAELVAGERVLARATAWWHRLGDTAAGATPTDPPPPLPPAATQMDPRDSWPGGYLDAMEWRWVKGHFAELGPATVWSRMRMPLVAGEEPSPTQRLLVSGDAGNGVGSTLPIEDWVYVNTELTAHLLRPPAGEWVCLDAAATIGPTGGGLAATVLSDVDGVVGRCAQALVVRPRQSPR